MRKAKGWKAKGRKAKFGALQTKASIRGHFTKKGYLTQLIYKGFTLFLVNLQKKVTWDSNLQGIEVTFFCKVTRKRVKPV